VNHQSHRRRTAPLLGLTAACFAVGCSEGSGKLPHGAGDVTGAGGTKGNDASAGTHAAAGSTCSPGEPTYEVGGACSTKGLGQRFNWKSTGALIQPIRDADHDIVSVKDPTVVFYENRWHVYATTANTSSSWSMVYLSFKDWSEAANATQYYIDANPNLRGYHCAPQVFYFTPQRKWYLVYQSQPPQYSTSDDLSKPDTWTAPKSFFAREPAIVTENKGTGTWLDFWVICDETHCFMFFSDDNGHWYRSRTAKEDFPEGFGDPVMALQDTKENLFEASNVYKLKGSDKYLALIEAFGEGRRYFRSWTADSLDGEWTPLADTWEAPFAGQNNVSFDECSPAWTEDISHGEFLRDGYDETLTVDPCHLRFLYQGAERITTAREYSQIPWMLGLLVQTD
jgi:hypothetical protein